MTLRAHPGRVRVLLVCALLILVAGFATGWGLKAVAEGQRDAVASEADQLVDCVRDPDRELCEDEADEVEETIGDAGAEVQDPEVNDPDPDDPETQDTELQNAEVQDPEVQQTETQEPERQERETQEPELQDPEVDDPSVPGPQGQQGPQGEPGAVGQPGKDGADGRPPESFTFTDPGGPLEGDEITYRCADPDADGAYTCETTGSTP